MRERICLNSVFPTSNPHIDAVFSRLLMSVAFSSLTTRDLLAVMVVLVKRASNSVLFVDTHLCKRCTVLHAIPVDREVVTARSRAADRSWSLLALRLWSANWRRMEGGIGSREKVRPKVEVQNCQWGRAPVKLVYIAPLKCFAVGCFGLY